MRENRSLVAALIAALVVLASLGPAAAARPAGTHATFESTNSDLTTDASTATSLRVHVYPQDDQLVVDASYEGDGSALVTIEALDGTYAGEGTYEIGGDETFVLPYPDESTTLKITVETDAAEESFVVAFERVVVACSDQEISIVRPVIVESSTAVQAKSTLVDAAVESSTILRANASHPDLPVECEADDHPNVSDLNSTVEEIRDRYNDSREEGESAYDDAHGDARDGYDESHDRARDGYEDSRDNARYGLEQATHFASQVYGDVLNFGHRIVGDVRGDAETIRDDAREDGEMVRQDANETGEQARENASNTRDVGAAVNADASASIDGEASVDENGASANGQADARVDASADGGPANAEIGIVGQVRTLIGVIVG